MTIKITSPLLPPLEAVTKYLHQIWTSEQITNSGALHNTLETDIATYLGSPHVSLVANGTLAVMGALAAAGVKPEIDAEIITTPFSFVATSQAVLQMGITPVFADVTPGTANLCPDQVRTKITAKTRAILPVHCYGAACDVDAFEALGAETGLPIVYDASHCFGATHRGQSLATFGDAASLSFHATKVFNTVEGGAVVTRTESAHNRIQRWRNFGYAGETDIQGIGINAKMSELHAAVGLANLDIVDGALEQRRQIIATYENTLATVSGIDFLPIGNNAPYYPILIGPNYSLGRDAVYDRLRAQDIIVRRYFYPLIPDFEAFKPYASQNDTLPHARKLADQIICLPVHHKMTTEDATAIAALFAKWNALDDASCATLV
jgi:dTDP-4-amino-4,6-dideoxygalactose transaminase